MKVGESNLGMPKKHSHRICNGIYLFNNQQTALNLTIYVCKQFLPESWRAICIK